MPDLFSLRRATTGDAQSISQLTAELGYVNSVDDIRSRLAELLNRDAHFIAVFEVPDGIGGWVAVEERLILESGLRGEIVGLVVGSRHRRKGVGKRLVHEAESWARSRGLRTVFVRSNVARVEAHPFYESLGFTRTKTQHAYQKELSNA